MSLLLFNTMSPLATRTHRAVDEEGPEDDDPEEDGAGGLDHLQVAVLVREEDHHGQTADDDALEDEEDGAEDHVERDNAGSTVHTLITTLRTLETLEGVLHVIQSHVDSLK